MRIGEVTDDGMLRVKERGTVVAEIPNRALTDEAPVYQRPMSEPEYLREVQQLDLDALDAVDAVSARRRAIANAALLALLGSPTIASKRWVYRQYDHMVRTNTVNLPGLGAGVVRIKGTDRALAMSVDGNGRYCYLDPYRGAMLAVAEAARNVACAGARPLGATNCLNFGNPERPAIMWQFAKAVEGIGAACRALGVPITGGNVSLYNETDGRAIYPTPVIGVVGLLEHADRVVSRRFQESGDAIVLLGEGRGELGGSEYLKVVHGLVRGVPPALDLDAERALQDAARRRSPTQRLVRSAHDCSDGGLAVTLAECCFDTGGIGAEVSIDARAGRRDARVNVAAALFGESASRVVVSRRARRCDRGAGAGGGGAACRRGSIGQTGGNRLRIAVGGADRHRSAGRRRRTRVVDGDRAVLREARGLKNMLDKFKDECGVFGIFGHPEAANMTYLGSLRAAAPRAGERRHRRVGRRSRCASRGRWATSPTSSTATTLAELPGPLAIGHVRYSTAGESKLLERAADPDRLRARPDCALPQRQPGQRAASCATSSCSRGRSSSRAATPKSSCTSTRGRRRAASRTRSSSRCRRCRARSRS